MNRVPLGIGTAVCGDRRYIIDGVVGDGANCIVYAAHYFDNANCNHSVLLKECYPFLSAIERHDDTLVWNEYDESERDLSAFADSYMKLMQFQNDEKHRNSTSAAFGIFDANGTKYSVINKDVGFTFDREKQKSLSDILETALALTKAVKLYHDGGYLHLDIKPSNFLVIPETRQLIKLFDMDTVIKKSDVITVPCIPYSEGWAAPELVLGQRNKVCEATDIYSIGAILFEKIMGRKAENDDTGVFAEWDFSVELFDGVNPRIKRLLIEIFKKTLAANADRRYQCAEELIAALDETIKTAKEKQYIVSEYPVSDINFVGRTEELIRIYNDFEHGTRAVFIHGVGGLGKTELAKKYIEMYTIAYDYIVYKTYNCENGLKSLIESITTTESDSERTTLDTLRKLSKDSKVLFVVDNFDVENDIDLNTFLSIDADIIFTTRNDYSEYFSSERIQILELETLSTDELLKLFANEYKKSISDPDANTVRSIIESFDNWTLIVPMVAKYLVASGTSIQEFSSIIEKDGLGAFGEDSEEIRININGKHVKKNQMNLIRYMFNVARLNQQQQEALRYLSLLSYHKCLTKDEYKKYTKSKNLNALNDLLFLGWASSNTNDDSIRVHPIIHELIKTDLAPTCKNVPGINEYINEKFDNLIQYTTIDEAKEITFAMLMHCGLSDEYESSERLYQKLSRFVLTHLDGNIGEIGKLLCEAPNESDWHMNAEYLVGRLIPLNTDNYWNEKYSIIYTSYYLILFTYLMSKYNDSEEAFEPSIVSSEDMILSRAKVPHCPQCNTALTNNFFCLQCETIIPEEKVIYPEIIEEDVSLDFSLIIIDMFTVTMYYEILKKADYDKNGIMRLPRTEEVISIENNPSLFLRIARLAQSTLIAVAKADDVDELFKLYSEATSIDYEKIRSIHSNLRFVLEDMLIQIYASLGQYRFYSDLDSMLWAVEIPNLDDYQTEVKNNKKLHWTKKASTWYDSVITSLEKSLNPIVIYRYILSSDTLFKKLKKSQVRHLVKNGFISKLLLDQRIEIYAKQAVMVFYVSELVNTQYDSICSWKRFGRRMQKYQYCYELYAQCFSLAEPLLENSSKLKPDRVLSLCRAALLIKKAGKVFPFNPSQFILNSITIENIPMVKKLLELANMTQWSGYIKKSQEMKNALLNLCLHEDFSSLSNEIKQYFFYQLNDLAENYKRTEIIETFEDYLKQSLKNEYYLYLLESKLVTDYERYCIARVFLYDFINHYLVNACADYHNMPLPYRLDTHELLIRERLDLIVTCLDEESGCIKEVFDRGQHNTPESLKYCGLVPYWISQFSDLHSAKALEGLTYLLFDYSINHYLDAGGWQELIDNTLFKLSTGVNGYSREEMKSVCELIFGICPDAEDPIKQLYWNGEYPQK